MNVKTFIRSLNEAGKKKNTAINKGAVYVFGPFLPEKGLAAPSFTNLVDLLKKYNVVKHKINNPLDLLEYLSINGYTFFFKKAPNDIEVIGYAPIEASREGIVRLMHYIGLHRHDKVLYRKTPNTTPYILELQDLIYGLSSATLRDIEKHKQLTPGSYKSKAFGMLTPEDVGLEFSANPTGLAHVVNPNKAQKTDQTQGTTQTAAQPQKGAATYWQIKSPLYLGIIFDLNFKDGILVKSVLPNSPAASSGLQPGDIIVQVGKFIRRDGNPPKAYYLRNITHLYYVLNMADSKSSIPLRIVRGDSDFWVEIKGEIKNA